MWWGSIGGGACWPLDFDVGVGVESARATRVRGNWSVRGFGAGFLCGEFDSRVGVLGRAGEFCGGGLVGRFERLGQLECSLVWRGFLCGKFDSRVGVLGRGGAVCGGGLVGRFERPGQLECSRVWCRFLCGEFDSRVGVLDRAGAVCGGGLVDRVIRCVSMKNGRNGTRVVVPV